MIVLHYCFRIAVFRHHLHLPVSSPLLQGARDGRAPEIVGRNFTDAGKGSPMRDDFADAARRQSLVKFERPVVVWG
jgi:hypothetical protein